MRRNFKLYRYAIVLLGIVISAALFACATNSSSPGITSDISPPSPATPVISPSQPHPTKFTATPMVVPYYSPPDRLDLCGESVPLENLEVLERFDREFTLVVYNHAQVYLWLKRMERYFPFFEERLRYYNLPDDLKYVAIVESDLLPNACSPKGAAGPWQFMPATACSYGLNQKGSCDERFDFELATDCAFRYLSDLYKRYKNWTLAIATYNCGDRRIQDQIRVTKSGDYYQMDLPTETERYVFRILAVKSVLSNPSRYGYNLPKGQGYPEFKIDRVVLKMSNAVSIYKIATASGCTYRDIKLLNPSLRGDDIPAGSYELKLPEGTGKNFERNFETIQFQTESGPPDDSDENARKIQESAFSLMEQANHPISRPESTASKAKPSGPANNQSKPMIEAPQRAARHEGTKQASKAPSVAQHTVKKGETLSEIARRYKTDVSELRKLNSIKGETLSPGQKLVIP
jgi:membrane-bound lytic murein transglycosylase D